MVASARGSKTSCQIILQLSLVTAGRPDQGTCLSRSKLSDVHDHYGLICDTGRTNRQSRRLSDWNLLSLVVLCTDISIRLQMTQTSWNISTKRVCHLCCCLPLQQLRRSHTTSLTCSSSRLCCWTLPRGALRAPASFSTSTTGHVCVCGFILTQKLIVHPVMTDL